MLDPYERWIQFHSLVINSAPSHAPEFELNDILAKVNQAVKRNEAIKTMNNDTASIRIAKMEIKPDHVRLLIQYANQNATDPVFMHMKQFKLRPVHRLLGEGIAVSGHAVLGRNKSTDDGTYPLLIEEVPGLGRSNIQPFLRALFKQVSEGHFTFKNEEKNNKDEVYRPVVELLDDPSVQFTQDLSDGSIEGIELVARIPSGESEFDEDGYFHESTRTVKISVLQQKRGLIHRLNILKNKAKEQGYSNLKIRYKKPQGKRRTVVMGTDIEDLSSAAVIRTELVKSHVPLEQCEDKINGKFVDEIVKLL